LIDITYVENAADAHIQAADALKPGSPLCGRPYFISQGKQVNCWQWINEVILLAGLPSVDRSIGLSAAYAAGLVLENLHRLIAPTKEPRMTRFLALQLARSHYFDISRAKHDIGYSPRISTAAGMQRLKAWLAAAPK
jgi:nucleoside-diphosphate-sugar epimerase